MGATILIVWPDSGPGAWIRERLLRRVLRGAAGKVLDCYICLGFWVGLGMSVLWWYLTHFYLIWFGCLMVPALFWLVLIGHRDDGKESPP